MRSGCFAYALMPTLLGMIAHVLHPGLPNHELALPTLFMNDLPFWVGALGLAAVFSAEVSASDAILFMLATSLSQDLYKRFVNPSATDRQVLSVARLASVAGGCLGVVVALMSKTIVDALTVFYTLLGVSLFVPIVAGLFTRRARAIDALGAIGAVSLRSLWHRSGMVARRSVSSRRRCSVSRLPRWPSARSACSFRDAGSTPTRSFAAGFRGKWST